MTVNFDADWANNVVERKSITGIYMEYNGKPVGWRPEKQTAVSQSTAKAEYTSTAYALQYAVYAQTLTKTLIDVKPQVVLENDKLPAIDMI